MKLRNPQLLKLVGWTGSRLMRLWMSTVRCSKDSQGQPTDSWNPRLRERYIYTIWHENMLVVPTLRSTAPVTALISQHRDGELIAHLCHCYGVHTIRGSSTRGGSEAIDEILQLRETSHVIILPDGPRGPRREVKRGLVYLASWTQMPIVPLGVGFTNAWQLGSWDRLKIPKPLSRITCVAGPIIRVPARAGKAALERYHRLLQSSMDEAARVAEGWARGKRHAPNWPLPLQRAA